jgi:hypothetical protein
MDVGDIGLQVYQIAIETLPELDNVTQWFLLGIIQSLDTNEIIGAN